MRKLLALMLAALLVLMALPLTGAMAEPVQEITFALNNEPDGIDPSVTNNSFASPILANCFEGLVTYDTATGSLIGGDAESWTISDDGTVYTFTLREGLKWSDGSPLTAQDYLYTFKRILTPATTAQYLSLLTDYIAGAQEYYDGTGTEEALGVKAPDDRTFVLTLKAPAPYYIDVLTMWTFSPVQKATVEANADKWTTSPDTYVVNGPFKVSELNMSQIGFRLSVRYIRMGKASVAFCLVGQRLSRLSARTQSSLWISEPPQQPRQLSSTPVRLR